MSVSNYAFDAPNDLSVGAVRRLMDDVFRPQYQQNVKLRKLIKEMGKPVDEVNVRGREFGVQLSRGSRTTGRPSMGYLPKPLPTSEARGSYTYAKLQKGISFDWETLRHMELSSAIVKLSDRLAQHQEKFEADASYFSYGDGSGALAVVTDVAGTGPYTLTVTATTDTYGGAGSNGTARLNIVEEVDIVSASAVEATVQIASIASATTFTCTVVSGTLTAGALTAIVVPSGSRPAGFNGASYMPHGVAYNCPTASSTDWWGINPSSAGNIECRSTVVDLSSASFTVGYANWLEDAVRHRRPMEKDDALTSKTKILIGVGQARSIKQSMNSIRRAGMGDKTFVLGAQNVANQWGNIWEEDPGCPDSRCYNLWMGSWQLPTLQELEYVDEGEGMWHLRPANTTSASGFYIQAYDGWTQEVMEIVNTEAFKQAAIVGIGVSTIQTAASLAHQF